jgi:hypothetical protein
MIGQGNGLAREWLGKGMVGQGNDRAREWLGKGMVRQGNDHPREWPKSEIPLPDHSFAKIKA